MTSEAQVRANQANAQFSTGPRTEEGKERASRNALRHGLTGRFILLNHESEEDFETHCAGYFDRFQPEGLPEVDLVESIAQDHWRIARARMAEADIFSLGVGQRESLGETWTRQSQVLARMTLYISRIERSIERNTKSLQALQGERRQIAAKQLEEAKLLTKLAWSRGEDYDPARDFTPETGFEFSGADLAVVVDRQIRLDEARHYERIGWDTPRTSAKPGPGLPKAA